MLGLLYRKKGTFHRGTNHSRSMNSSQRHQASTNNPITTSTTRPNLIVYSWSYLLLFHLFFQVKSFFSWETLGVLKPIGFFKHILEVDISMLSRFRLIHRRIYLAGRLSFWGTYYAVGIGSSFQVLSFSAQFMLYRFDSSYNLRWCPFSAQVA